MIKRIYKKGKRDNRGAALITVIVVVSFISILATIFLYAAGKNFYMKSTDQMNKEGFYDGEKALEEIKAALMIDSQNAFEKAYENCMASYIMPSSTGLNLSGSDDRQETFNKAFVEEFDNIWQDHLATYGSEVSYLQSKIDNGRMGSYTLMYDRLDPSESIKLERTPGKVTVGTISYEYIDSRGTVIRISTEYVIQAPTSCWGGEPTGPDPIDEESTLIGTVNYQNWTKK